MGNADQPSARTPFVAGNWKMNTDRASAVALATAVAKGADGAKATLGVTPPFVYLESVRDALGGSSKRVMLGAQDAYFEPSGAFTGEVSVDMLKDVGCDYVLTGHSERRHVLLEGTELVANKAAAVYRAGLTLVHCVGETLPQREADQTLSIVEQQLAELTPAIDDPSRLVIAYEPVWAIGTGKTATDEQAQEVHAYIRDSLGQSWDKDFADRVRILYGGSMKPDNAAGLLAKPDVDGGLIGGASLKAESFLAIGSA